MVDRTKIQSNGLTVEENGLRLLAVMYTLSDGQAGVPLHQNDIWAECARVGIFKMTASEFEEYRLKTISAAHALDAEVIG